MHNILEMCAILKDEQSKTSLTDPETLYDQICSLTPNERFDIMNIALSYREHSQYIAGFCKLFNQSKEPDIISDPIYVADDVDALRIKVAHATNEKWKQEINTAAEYGAIRCFKFLQINNAPITAATLYEAVDGGNKEIVSIIVSSGIPLSQETLECSIQNHRNDIMKWHVEHHGFELTPEHFRMAVTSLNLGGALYVRDHIRLAPPQFTPALFISQFMLEQGAPFTITDRRYIADFVCRDITQSELVLLTRLCNPVDLAYARPNDTMTLKHVLPYLPQDKLTPPNNSFGPTLLQSTKNPECAKLLLEAGANPNCVTINDGMPCCALQTAVLNGNYEITDMLFQYGVDPNTPGFPALHFFLRTDNLDAVEYLIKNKADVNLLSYEKIPLQIAHLPKQFDLLIAAGAHANNATSHDVIQTCLKCGVSLSVIETIVERGYSMALENKAIFTHVKTPETLDVLIKCGLAPPPLDLLYLENVQLPTYYLAKKLIQAKLHFSPEDLFFAISRRDPNMVELLLRSGIDPNFVNIDGVSLIVHAIDNGNHLIIKRLFHYGATFESAYSIQIPGKAVRNGTSDIAKMIFHPYCDVAGTLIRHGWPFEQDHLVQIFKSGCLSLVEAVVAKGVNPDTIINYTKPKAVPPTSDSDWNNSTQWRAKPFTADAPPLGWGSTNSFSAPAANKIVTGWATQPESSTSANSFPFINASPWAQPKPAVWGSQTPSWASGESQTADLPNSNVYMTDHCSLFHIAVMSDSADVVKFLLANGANPNVASPTGVYPLETATTISLDMVITLLEGGADGKIQSQYGTPLKAAMTSLKCDSALYIIDNVYGKSDSSYLSVDYFALAVNNRRSKVVDRMIDDGFDLNQCLHLTTAALRCGSDKLVIWFIENNHISLFATREYKDPVTSLVMNCSPEVIVALKKHIPTTDFTAAFAEISAAPYHTIRGFVAMIETLLSNGVNPNPVRPYAGKIMYAAIRNNDMELAKVMLTHGADPNKPIMISETLGQQPLNFIFSCMASSSWKTPNSDMSLHMADLFIEHGAVFDISATPMWHIFSAGRKYADLLLANGYSLSQALSDLEIASTKGIADQFVHPQLTEMLMTTPGLSLITFWYAVAAEDRALIDRHIEMNIIPDTKGPFSLRWSQDIAIYLHSRLPTLPLDLSSAIKCDDHARFDQLMTTSNSLHDIDLITACHYGTTDMFVRLILQHDMVSKLQIVLKKGTSPEKMSALIDRMLSRFRLETPDIHFVQLVCLHGSDAQYKLFLDILEASHSLGDTTVNRIWGTFDEKPNHPRLLMTLQRIGIDVTMDRIRLICDSFANESQADPKSIMQLKKRNTSPHWTKPFLKVQIIKAIHPKIENKTLSMDELVMIHDSQIAKQIAHMTDFFDVPVNNKSCLAAAMEQNNQFVVDELMNAGVDAKLTFITEDETLN